ncbi:hypothetical protein BTO15_11265 [Polaribacter sejongensis]|uniref:Prolipoprotein diacylglyceryl transferase n=1 Tax=Polaribacter sejongensis TaxID=985043 RepID=A0ABM6Q0F1_9FLAO|nr:hypothetical protein BTO15_11265 [Polaribacter sejongensis]
MINFTIQIIASIFVGVCFMYLAKRFQKNNIFYFCIGFFVSLTIRIIYLLIYGFFTDFKLQQDFEYNRNLSVLLSVIISCLFFGFLRKRLKNKNLDYQNINEIGA